MGWWMEEDQQRERREGMGSGSEDNSLVNLRLLAWRAWTMDQGHREDSAR